MVDGQEITELYCEDTEKVKAVMAQDSKLAKLIEKAEELERRLVERYYGK